MTESVIKYSMEKAKNKKSNNNKKSNYDTQYFLVKIWAIFIFITTNLFD